LENSTLKASDLLAVNEVQKEGERSFARRNEMKRVNQ